MNFTVNDKTFLIKKPTPAQSIEAQKYYNKTFSDALQSGAVLRAALDKYLRQQNVWDDERQKEYDKLQKQLRHKVNLILKGGMTVNDAKELAMDARKLRQELRDLTSVKLDADISTAESQAEQARMNYLCSVCILNPTTEKSYFDSYDEFLEHSNETEVMAAVNKFMTLLYDLDDNIALQYPENQFLRRYNFIDDEGRLINKDGKLVDEQGRLINEDGRLINSKGEFIDTDGNIVDKKGKYDFNNITFLEE